MATQSGFLSDEDIAQIRKTAQGCDDEQRQASRLRPRPTRCQNCAVILTLIAHIELTDEQRQQLERRIAELEVQNTQLSDALQQLRDDTAARL